MASDAKMIVKWSKVKSPRKALKEIIKHDYFFGYDPYYAGQRRALLPLLKDGNQWLIRWVGDQIDGLRHM